LNILSRSNLLFSELRLEKILMKQILIIIIISAATLSFAGCGSGADAPTATATLSPTAVATNTPQPKPTATETPSPSVAESAAPDSPLEAPFESPLEAPFESPLEAPFESPIEAPFESPLLLPLPEAVYPEVAPDAETGVLMGRIVSIHGQQPRLMPGASVRLGTIYWNPSDTDNASSTPTAQEDGVFVIEGGSSPGALTDDAGIFVIKDLPSGEYVMAVGDLIGIHEFIIAENGEDAEVFKVEVGAVLNVGTIEVTFP
jgi:hypothetical protein